MTELCANCLSQQSTYHAQTSPSLTSSCSLFLFIKSVQLFSLKSVLADYQLTSSCPSTSTRHYLTTCAAQLKQKNCQSSEKTCAVVLLSLSYSKLRISEEYIFPKLITTTRPVFTLKSSSASSFILNLETDGTICP